MSKKPPSKPEREVGVIVFPKDGAPYLDVERLPGEQDKQELIAVKKLLGALAHFKDKHYRNPRVGSGGTDDIVCESEDGSTIEIQVAWTGDDNIRQLREMRDSYVNVIANEHLEVLKAFHGCNVDLVDTGDPPYLPRVKTIEGQRCLDELVSGLMNIGSQIDTLQVGKISGRKLNIGPDRREIGVICERLPSTNNDMPCSIRWTGSLPVYGGDGRRNTLSETVLKKINKSYAKPENEFWLLIYSTDLPLTDTDPDISSAQEILNKSEHPFDIVWYLHPHPNLERGILIKVWPPD